MNEREELSARPFSGIRIDKPGDSLLKSNGDLVEYVLHLLSDLEAEDGSRV